MDHRIQQLQHHPLKTVKQTVKKSNQFDKSFEEIFKDAQDLKVSKHAQKRLVERGITIDQQNWNRLGAKLEEAKNKGVNDSLVIMNNAALVVSIKNNTVITAMDRQEANSQIFTNINGTIILD